MAQALLQKDIERRRAAQRRTVNLADRWSQPVGERCPLTFGLIAISAVVAYFMWYQSRPADSRLDLLYFSSDETLQPILHGEVWRLITPIFLHFSWMHLIFNMLCTQQFGMQIESRKGTSRFFGMVLVIAIVSNLVQFLFGGPHFGGMSGVNYGLFGYIWVKGKLEPESGFYLPQQTILMMLCWHVVCMMGWIPNIANWAHGAGLVAGVALGMSASLLKPFLRQK